MMCSRVCTDEQGKKAKKKRVVPRTRSGITLPSAPLTVLQSLKVKRKTKYWGFRTGAPVVTQYVLLFFLFVVL